MQSRRTAGLFIIGIIVAATAGWFIFQSTFESPGNDVWIRNTNAFYPLTSTSVGDPIEFRDRNLPEIPGTLTSLDIKVGLILNYNDSLPTNYLISLNYEIWKTVQSTNFSTQLENTQVLPQQLTKGERLDIPLNLIFTENPTNDMYLYTFQIEDIQIIIDNHTYYLEQAQCVRVAVFFNNGKFAISQERLQDRDLMFSYLPPPPTDTDNDGLTDDLEDQMGTDPTNIDTDYDGLTDIVDPQPTTFNPPVIPEQEEPTKDNNLWIWGLVAIPIIGILVILFHKRRH